MNLHEARRKAAELCGIPVVEIGPMTPTDRDWIRDTGVVLRYYPAPDSDIPAHDWAPDRNFDQAVRVARSACPRNHTWWQLRETITGSCVAMVRGFNIRGESDRPDEALFRASIKAAFGEEIET